MSAGDGRIERYRFAALALARTIVGDAEPDGERGLRWSRRLPDGRRHHPLDLYAGAAGVIWFLGAASRHTGDTTDFVTLADPAERALDAAWKRALERGHCNPAVVCGEGGLLWGELALALQWGRLDQVYARVVERADALRRQAEAKEVTANELFYGAAGAGITWLSAFHLIAGSFIGAALECGKHLERTAIEGDGCCSWTWGPMADGYEDRSPYVGLAHGPAGIALFLMELFAATRDARWRELGERALTWVLAQGQRRFGGLVFPVHALPGSRVITYWCHGAAGIAIAFLHAARITGEARWREAAEACVAATDHFLADHEVRWPGQCHGVAGNLETLIEASVILDDPAWLERARDHADRLLLPRIRRHEGRTILVPAESPEPAADLGTGRAGVGIALLRLIDPTIPHHVTVLRAAGPQ